MKVSLLIIGNEILNGKTTDANTRFLAEFLMRNHFHFSSALTVRDDEESIHKGLTQLITESEVVITSGGLGPTKDDITKSALAHYFKREVVYSEESEKIALANYTRLKRDWPGKEHEYAKLPVGFVALANSIGFAPSFYVEEAGGLVLSAPGVPREFKAIIEDHLVKITEKRRGSHEFLDLITVRTKKVPEEKIFGEVDPELWNKLSHYGDVSSLPTLMGVDICVKTKAPSLARSSEMKKEILAIFETSPIHPHVWHYGPETIEEVILEKAKSKKLTFGFAESATGGLCSHRMTGVPGVSEVFHGSVICYDTSVKINMLEVQVKTIKEKGVVSLETAQEMAQGLAKKLKLDLAVSITGLAGPGGGSPEIPVGTVCIGVCHKGKTTAQSFKLFGEREQLKNRFAQLAMLTLLEEVEKFA